MSLLWGQWQIFKHKANIALWTIPATVVVFVVMEDVGRGVVSTVTATIWQGGAVDSSFRCLCDSVCCGLMEVVITTTSLPLMDRVRSQGLLVAQLDVGGT